MISKCYSQITNSFNKPNTIWSIGSTEKNPDKEKFELPRKTINNHEAKDMFDKNDQNIVH